MDKREKKLADILDPGWQFYTKPTTLEPPGTVFRIDSDERRYTVETLEVEIITGKEASGRSVKSVETAVGILARLFGFRLFNIGAKRKKVERLYFEMAGSVIEKTTDMAMDRVLDPFIENLKPHYRADYRYFVIREVRMVSAMKYYLSEDLVNEMGGGAPLIEGIAVEGKLSRGRQGEYELDQEFAEPMRVMFLPEEITTITAGLAGSRPELGIVPVQEVLFWEEG